MLKKFFKTFFYSMGIFLLTVVIGYVSYQLTLMSLKHAEDVKQTNRDTVRSVSKNSEEVNVAAAANGNNGGVIEFQYYLVRKNGNKLGVYACNQNKEEFLYDVDVYMNDMPEQDLKLLEQGIVVYSKAELTGFLENFTS